MYLLTTLQYNILQYFSYLTYLCILQIESLRLAAAARFTIHKLLSYFQIYFCLLAAYQLRQKAPTLETTDKTYLSEIDLLFTEKNVETIFQHSNIPFAYLFLILGGLWEIET